MGMVLEVRYSVSSLGKGPISWQFPGRQEQPWESKVLMSILGFQHEANKESAGTYSSGRRRSDQPLRGQANTYFVRKDDIEGVIRSSASAESKSGTNSEGIGPGRRLTSIGQSA